MWPVIALSPEFTFPVWITVVSLSASFAIWWWMRRVTRYNFDYSRAITLAWIILLSMLVGGRLTHVSFEEPSFYSENLWLIFQVWNGGFVFYGGLLLSFVTLWIYLKFQRDDVWRWLDLLAPVIALTYALGRLGCFANGCCYGRYCPYPWGVSFPHHHVYGILEVPRHPTQLYAFAWEMGLLALLLWVERSRSLGASAGPGASPFFQLRTPGDLGGGLFLLWLKFHAIGRLIMEYFRDDPRGPKLLNLSLGSWISLSLLVAASLIPYFRDQPSTREQV